MTDISDLHTIRDLVRWAVSRFNEAGLFYGHGSDTAWDEAMTLVLRGLHLPHEIPPTVLDARITAAERSHLQHLIHRRIHERIPVAYLIHEAWFAGLPYYVDERVLIPRSPIAELIEQDFHPWLAIDADDVRSILDLCTGSGCIAIACAKAFPDATIDASDISNDALTVAKMNVLRHSVEDQVHLHQSNLFAALPKKKYDIIVSNPPYVDAEDMASLPSEYKHEPELALAAGPKGLDFALRILREADEYLTPEGILIIEVGNSEYAMAEAFPEIPFTWLEFQRGGGGVFLLTAQQVKECQSLLKSEI
jgi:ribosomal protein L3 glutamine methyltransferase